MLGLEPDIEAEYQRFLKELEDEDERLTVDCLTIGEVLKAHFLIANHFYLEGYGLGGIGPKDIGLLQSAVHRQHITFGGKAKWADRYDICATLFFGLIKNHPFYDANKRTAFLSALYQLHRHGRCPAVGEKEFEDFTVQIASNALGKFARYKELTKSGGTDPEVKFIAWYLRKNTRDIDKNIYSITYRELQTILGRYGFGLTNPQGNYIDIIKREKRRSLMGFGGEKENEVRIGRIGFPRWTAQVSKAALRTVRDVTGLTEKNGFDSASFFRGLDPMQALITAYHGPLMRLAER